MTQYLCFVEYLGGNRGFRIVLDIPDPQLLGDIRKSPKWHRTANGDLCRIFYGNTVKDMLCRWTSTPLSSSICCDIELDDNYEIKSLKPV